MPVFTEEDLKTSLPSMVKIRQKFSGQRIGDVETAVRRQLEQDKISRLLKPGQRIAVAVGSRGISNLGQIVGATVSYLKERGAIPFIVPAMGSHGGATAAGQQEVLASLGVTEEAAGAPIIAAMDVVLLGATPAGIPVYMDKAARAADMVVLINRIKPHTSFKGPIESGLCKLMAIGLGKHIGCSRLHEEKIKDFSALLRAVAEVFLAKGNIGFGIGIVENAFEETADIQALAKEEILAVEPELQAKAKALMPRLLVPAIDVLVVEQIGKDISGAGMDVNIIGRSAVQGRLAGHDGPITKRIVVLDLSAATHGNASGIGSADFITRNVFEKFDALSTYSNAIASGMPEGAHIPIVLENEREAVIAAVRCCGTPRAEGPYIVRIKDTLHLSEIWISENMLPLIAANQSLEVVG